jgi:hypothetical protein
MHTKYLCGMNKFLSRPIDTRHATVERTSASLVEIRFKPDVTLDVAGVGEVIAAKQRICAEGEADILAVLPPDMDLEMTVVSADHHALFGDCTNSRRLALAAPDDLNRKLAEIHYRYHPRQHDTAVFMAEDEARAWLATPPARN